MAKRGQLDMNRLLKQISVEVPKNLEKFANREARKKADAIKKEVFFELFSHIVGFVVFRAEFDKNFSEFHEILKRNSSEFHSEHQNRLKFSEILPTSLNC